MAAVTAPNVHPVLVESAKIGKAAADLLRGKPVVIDSAATVDPRYPTTYKAADDETRVHGFVLYDAKAGNEVEVMCFGEFEGFTGMTPGAELTVVNGAIDATAPAEGIPSQLTAISATRLWVHV